MEKGKGNVLPTLARVVSKLLPLIDSLQLVAVVNATLYVAYCRNDDRTFKCKGHFRIALLDFFTINIILKLFTG